MRGKRIVVGLICAVMLVGVIWRFAPSQVTQSLPQSRWQPIFGKVQPLLEEELGWKFPTTPEIREVTADKFAEVPGFDLKAFLSWRFPASSRTIREKAYHIAHHTECLAAPARHVEGTAVILVAPNQLSTIAGWDKSLAEANSTAFLQLLLVHEAAKMALEKKHNLLDRRYNPQSLEEFQVLQALREGKAQWLTWRVAKRLGAEKVFPLLARRWLHVPDFAPDANLKSICHSAYQQKYWAYTKGLAFFETLDQARVAGLEKRVFATPPRQVGWINDPRLFLRHGLAARLDLRGILATIDKKHGPTNLRGRQQPWTPKMLQQVAELLGAKEQASHIATGWEDGRSLLWTAGNPTGKYIALTIVKYATDKDARRYFGFAVDMQRKRDEVSAKSPYFPLRTVSSRYVPIKMADLADAVQNEKIVRVGEKGPTLPVTVIVARSGSLVFELQWQGYRADVAWGKRVIAEVRQRTVQ